jgi:cold shock CspA family protein
MESPNNRRRGRLRQWHPDRGFGFIYSQGERFFLHVSQIISGVPEIGRICVFDIGIPPTAADRAPALDVEIGEMANSPSGEASHE